LSVGVGLGVLAELMEEEEEVVEVVGAKGKHKADRVAVRHGRESGEVTLGARRVAVEWSASAPWGRTPTPPTPQPASANPLWESDRDVSSVPKRHPQATPWPTSGR
jgi:hypothetical protein